MYYVIGHRGRGGISKYDIYDKGGSGCQNMMLHYVTYFHYIWRHVYIMFEDMFLLCLKTHLHNCLRLFTQFLKIYFHHVKRHAFTIFLDIYKQGLKTLSYHVWRFVMTLCKDMLTISLKQVWCTMTTYVHFGNLFTYSNVWKHV